MIDSSMKNLGEVEYNKQNWLQHQKSQIRPLIVNCVEVRKIYWNHVEKGFQITKVQK